MLPTPEIRRLIEQRALESGAPPTKRCVERRLVECVVEDVGRDVRDLGRKFGATDRDRQPAERALIDEAQLRPVVVERDPHPKMRAGRRRWLEHQQLAAHPEMRKHGVTGIQRQPQVLSATTGTDHSTSD